MKNVSVLLVLPLLLVACGDSSKPGAAGGDSATTAMSSASDTAAHAQATTASGAVASGTAPANPYDVKSGIVAMKNTMANGEQKIYFDDYGRKQAIYIDMDIMGKKMQSIQLVNDGWVYTYEAGSKTGQKMREPAEGVLPVPEPAALTEQKKKEFSYKELEPRELVGKQAEGYSIEITQTPGSPTMAMRTWRWKRVPLRMEMQMPGGTPIITEVTKAEFDVDIPADRFAVPADVKFAEQPEAPGQGGPTEPTPQPRKP